MLRTVASSPARLRPDDDRHFVVAAVHIARLGDVVEELVCRLERKVRVHLLHNRVHAEDGCAEAGAYKAVLADR